MRFWRHAVVVCAACALFVSGTRADVTGTTGGGATHENVQPSLGLNYVIAIEGVFPTNSPDEGGGSALEPFLGEVMLFAGQTAPRGWAFCQGQLLPVNQNQALHAVIGTTYGSSGGTHFALPDLRGRVPIGMGQGPGLSNRARGELIGVEAVALTEVQLPSHSHPLSPSGSTGATGGGAPHTEMQPSLGMSYLIAEAGVFPPRGGSGGGINPFYGEVMLFAGNAEPFGWDRADGSLRPASPTDPLNAILGTQYGGDGHNTYALPDLRGRTPIGAGYGVGLTEREVGDSVGTESIALSTGELPPHSHTLPPPGGTTGLTGGGAAHSNMQPSLAMNYIISLEGFYPTSGSGGGADPFIGEIALFAGNYAPEGWAHAQGQLMPVSEYEALFNVIGNTFGGDGVETFALPDLSGRAAIGIGAGPGLTSRQMGQKVGSEDVALTVAQLPAHSHTVGTVLAGDYNENGAVDAADYAVWRDRLGSPMSLPNDDSTGVGPDDYTRWRTNFGRSLGAGSGSSASLATPLAVPEPASVLLLIATAFGLLLVR